MVKPSEKIFIILMLMVLFIGLISSSFSIGNPSHLIEKSYGPSEFLKGWINISLDSESVNSMFNTGLGGSVKLASLIWLNELVEGKNYTCTPAGCGIDYAAVEASAEAEKSFILNYGEEKILGLKISGGVVSDISDFSMKVVSNAEEAREPQLYIDLFNDDVIEWQSYLASGSFGNKDYGCYNAPALGQAKISNDLEYCEKINIAPAPNVKIGAHVIEDSGIGESVDFVMNIYDKDYFYFGSCMASASGTGEVGCVPDNFGIAEKEDFFVCISAENAGDNDKYRINYEREEECGFTQYYSGQYYIDFEIFARAGTYDDVGGFVLNNTELSNAGFYNQKIGDAIWNYLNTKYDNDCSGDCIIPIKFISGSKGPGGGELDHEITISDINLAYVTDIRDTTGIIYDLTPVPAKISSIDSGFVKLNLDKAGFSVPSEYGTHIFSLEFNDEEVFSEDIVVEKVPVIEFLTPIATAAVLPTTFKTGIDTSASGANITKYEWDFGDNTTATTSKNEVVHTYESTGTYNLTIKVTDSEGLSDSETFSISVETPIQAVEQTLDEKMKDLKKVKSDMGSFSSFHQASLEPILNLTGAEDALTNIQSSYNSTTNQTTDDEYIDMMKGLLEIELPKSIQISISADSLLFYPEETNIDLNILQSIGGGDYGAADEKEYINAILMWDQENLNTKISFEEITVVYESFDKPILRTFELEVKKRIMSEQNPYIILRQLENLEFKEDYSELEKSGYIYMELRESEKTIEFTTTQDLDFIDLPLFISPAIDQLSLTGTDIREEPFEWRSVVLFLVIFLLLLVGIIIYIVLQNWYKKKYEKYLFKNKNDMYNIVSYINRMKKRGLEDRDLVSNLRKEGWKSEQIKYAVRKYGKKRTGMFEIPVDKILERLKENKRKRE